VVTGAEHEFEVSCVTCQDGDVSEFVFVSGRHALDFAGTVLWRRTARTELLQEPGDLQQWAREAGVLDDMEPPSPADVHTAREVREAIYHAVSAAVLGASGPSPHDIDVLNALARQPLPLLTLTPGGDTTSSGTFAQVASLLARDAIDLIGSADRAKVKECSNPDCTRLFVDHSRGASRRWCGMAECGNRAKAADYRRRKKQASAARV
jgi:predicted RNA-binding Zn ribbon-like protein